MKALRPSRRGLETMLYYTLRYDIIREGFRTFTKFAVCQPPSRAFPSAEIVLALQCHGLDDLFSAWDLSLSVSLCLSLSLSLSLSRSLYMYIYIYICWHS